LARLTSSFTCAVPGAAKNAGPAQQWQPGRSSIEQEGVDVTAWFANDSCLPQAVKMAGKKTNGARRLLLESESEELKVKGHQSRKWIEERKAASLPNSLPWMLKSNRAARRVSC